MNLIYENSKYRVSDIQFYPIDKKNCILIDSQGEMIAKIPLVLTILLEKCNEFKTLDSHIDEIWNKLSFSKKRVYFRAILETYMLASDEFSLSFNMFGRMLKEIFKFLISKKAFISFEEFTSIRSNSEENEKGITIFSVLTNHRPIDLSSSIDSFFLSEKLIPPAVKFIVFDDTREVIQGEECRRNLKDLTKKFNRDIFYCGKEEKKLMIDELVFEGFNKEIIEFALLGDRSIGATYGANRNAFLLETIGEKAFSADDDIKGKFSKTPKQTNHIRLANDYSLNIKVFHKREEILRSLDFIDDNSLAIHNDILGFDLFHALRSKKPSAILTEKLFSDFFKQIRFSPSKIRMTFPGIAGDSGSSSSEFYLFLEDESIKDLTQNDSHFKMAIGSREILKYTDKISLSRPTNCMTTCFGLDNSDLLPPFFPVLRNEDHLFTELLRLLHPNDLIAHLPWVFVHSPSEIRTNGASISLDQPTLSMDDIIKTTLLNFNFGHAISSPEIRIKLISKHIQCFLELSKDRQIDLLQQHLWLNHSKRILSYTSLLEKKPGIPKIMKDEVSSILKRYHSKKIQRISFFAPTFLVDEKGEKEATRLTQDLISRYARLLEIWPEIYSFVKKRKLAGKHMSRSISSF